MSEADSPATRFAEDLLAELISRGVRHVVVCPGSRSQALALAAAAAEQSEAIHLHVRVDERSAGYFALGIARETGVPAPVIVTSGGAVAQLMPAALEAHEARVPFLMLTADRPDELHGVRANQTTNQARLMESFARLVVDVDAPGAGPGIPAHEPAALAESALAAALGGVVAPGPVHLNLAFREPLSATGDEVAAERFVSRLREASEAARAAEASGPAELASAADASGPVAAVGLAADASGPASVSAPTSARTDPDASVYIHSGDRLAVVVAGADAAEEAEAFAHEAGLPLLAEVVSRSRYGREAITSYASLIDDPDVGGLIERTIVFGHPTLTRHIPALLGRDDVDTIVVDPWGVAGSSTPPYDPHRTARVVRSARVDREYAASSMRRWLGEWLRRDRELRAERSTVHEPNLEAALAVGYKERSSYARDEVRAMREPISRAMLAEHVWRATWPHDRLVVAASRMVRELDAIAQPRKVSVHANRGLAGIDGTIATALGIAAASQTYDDPSQAAGVTRVLLGDLALLHDVGSLMLSPGEAQPRVQLFVANDGGGTIFDGLEVADSASPDHFDRVMYTPQTVTIESLAAAYGWEYVRATTRGDLDRVFTSPVTGPVLVEVPIAR